MAIDVSLRTRAGRCLCGGVTFVVTGELGPALNCYCSICRRAHSSAFRTRVAVGSSQLTWLSGNELIASFESSPGHDRQFCRRCGSRLATVLTPGDRVGLPLALLDDVDDVMVGAHVHVSSKPAWVEICGDAPCHAELPSPMRAAPGRRS